MCSEATLIHVLRTSMCSEATFWCHERGTQIPAKPLASDPQSRWPPPPWMGGRGRVASRRGILAMAIAWLQSQGHSCHGNSMAALNHWKHFKVCLHSSSLYDSGVHAAWVTQARVSSSESWPTPRSLHFIAVCAKRLTRLNNAANSIAHSHAVDATGDASHMTLPLLCRSGSGSKIPA